MNIVKFISVDYLKKNTVIQQNTDERILEPFILSAQDTHIQQALGTTFYDRLKSGVTANNLTQLEEDFMRTYIMPALAQWTFYECFPYINYKMTNKAVSKESSEFSAPAELDEIKYMRNSIRDLAEFYLRRINNYLCDYGYLFPEYNNPDSKENLVANSKSYFSGVYTQRRGIDLFPNIPHYYGDRFDCRDCGDSRGC